MHALGWTVPVLVCMALFVDDINDNRLSTDHIQSRRHKRNKSPILRTTVQGRSAGCAAYGIGSLDLLLILLLHFPTGIFA